MDLIAVLGLAFLTGCTGSPSAQPSPAPQHPQTVLPAAATEVVPGSTAPELALATSRMLYQRSPAVVLVAQDDAASLPEATQAAQEMGVPLLLAPAAEDAAAAAELQAELERLQVAGVLPIGSAAQSPSPAPSLGGQVLANAALTEYQPGSPLDQLLVIALDVPEQQAAIVTARASGARVLMLSDPDPRASDEAITALAGQSTAHVLALGDTFGPAERLRSRVDTAATGVRLPAGRQVVFPGRRIVALYGHPGDARLGSLGEQSAEAAVSRARKVAAEYAALVGEPVVPAFEIIATVASSGAGSDGNYSSESAVEHLRPWVDAARDAGIYVMLDLQPGRTDFLTQAKLYRELLLEPHVGLALDPEWRLKPHQRHLVQIGSVTAAEINKTAAWLAQLTRDNRLPQKILMVHQFRLDMVTNRSTLDTSHDELQVVIHADGFGTPGQKFETWRFLRLDPPPSVWWGWKNFYDEDRPTFTPAETVAIKPSPVYISYQ